MEKIEIIEEICLSVLIESKDPWVPLETLIQKCKDRMRDDRFDEAVIVSFLRSHPEIKVLDPFYINIPEVEGLFKRGDLKLQPIAILKRRLPDEKDIMIWLYRHTENLLEMLKNMEITAETETKKQQIGMVINKTKNLLWKLKDPATGIKDGGKLKNN